MGERRLLGCFNKHSCTPGVGADSHPAASDTFPALSPAEALRRSQTPVDEITCHFGILGRLMQEFSEETMAHEARLRTHMARMAHSPIHRARARRDGDLSGSSRTVGEHGGVREEGHPHGGGEAEGEGQDAGNTTFPWLNPGGLFTDTLSSMEGEDSVYSFVFVAHPITTTGHT